jgi:release factor glutamine methyltransferase
VLARLTRAGCVAAEEEAAELAAAASDDSTLEGYLRRRENGEPLAWITGSLRFCDATIGVDPGVYVPRLQSEELARRAGDVLAACGPGATAVDLCTGAGAIAVHLRQAAPHARVVALDLDAKAVTCARRNGLTTARADAGRPPLRPDLFDLVTVVAPYVPTKALTYLPSDVVRHEPPVALDGGSDGLDVLRAIIPAAASLLRVGGRLFAEIGGDQDRSAAELLTSWGFVSPDTWEDEDGDLRGVEARLA